MSQNLLRSDSLVLYKQRAARVTSLNDKKLEITTNTGESYSVRPKDVALLHPGPVKNFAALHAPQGEVSAAWELLAGQNTTLPELAELAFGAYTPASAWAAWKLVADGLYFSGVPETIVAHTEDQVNAVRATREAKAAEERAWHAFAERIAARRFEAGDERHLIDIAALALEQREQSRILRTLGFTETPQQAHTLLLEIGFWKPTRNPYPQRLKVATNQPDLPLPELPVEERRNLTHLISLAIDDEGNRDPDDALSWDNGRLWVHVADAAALITPDSPADLEARSRGASLYLPEGTIMMLPPAATPMLGLGLQETSPALSFGITLSVDGEIQGVEVVPSWVRVTRLTYEQAELRLEESPFRELLQAAQAYAAHRLAHGAIELNLPEAKIRVEDGQVLLRPLPPLRSRDLVRDAMLMAGEAVARYAITHNLAIPFTVQEITEEATSLPKTTLSEMFALRRLLKPSRQTSMPGAHAGLGMEIYAQCTSPLRRYGDLVIHQQLRAHLRFGVPLTGQAVIERVAEASEMAGDLRRVERLSNNHWTLVYLLQHPEWHGEGVVVEQRGNRSLVVIPELAFETEIYGRPDLKPDEIVKLALNEVNLPVLEAKFRIDS